VVTTLKMLTTPMGPRAILTSYFCTLLPTHRDCRSRTRELSGLPCARHALARVVPTGDRAAGARFAGPALDVLKGGGRLRRCRHAVALSIELVAFIRQVVPPIAMADCTTRSRVPRVVVADRGADTRLGAGSRPTRARATS
jgi:hypothetical protein